jgi:hypothetical protein
MLTIFSSEKFDGFRPGKNPRSWVPEASMLTTRLRKPLRERERERERERRGRRVNTDAVTSVVVLKD